MDGVARSGGCNREEEAPEKGEESCPSEVVAAVEKITRSNHKIRSLRDEIVVVRKELSDLRASQNVEQYPCGHEVVVAVEVEGNEFARGDAHEEVAVEERGVDVEGEGNGFATCDAHEEVAVDEPSVDVEGEGNEFGRGDRDEEATVHQPTDEPTEEQGVPLQHPPGFIDIADDDADEVNSHVEPMFVEPLTTFVGDLRTTVDVDRLYYIVTRKDIVRR